MESMAIIVNVTMRRATLSSELFLFIMSDLIMQFHSMIHKLVNTVN